MRGRSLLLILALFVAAADALSWQSPGSSASTGEPATATTSPETSLGQPSEQGPLAPDDDNQKLREKILNVLRAHSSLASSNFNVEVSDSRIELSGSVPTAREKEIARRIAQSFGNNRTVAAAKIEVRNAGGAQGTQSSQR